MFCLRSRTRLKVQGHLKAPCRFLSALTHLNHCPKYLKQSLNVCT